jgi:hypothetical protein
MLKTKDVKASIFNHVATGYSGDVNWDSPTKFDPDAEDVESWVALFVDVQEIQASRAAADEGRVTIMLDIFSRKQDKAYETEKLLDDMRAVLPKGGVIPVQDFEVSDETLVGYVRLHEPVIRDMTQDGDQWRRSNVRIEGRLTEIPG